MMSCSAIGRGVLIDSLLDNVVKELHQEKKMKINKIHAQNPQLKKMLITIQKKKKKKRLNKTIKSLQNFKNILLG